MTRRIRYLRPAASTRRQERSARRSGTAGRGDRRRDTAHRRRSASAGARSRGEQPREVARIEGAGGRDEITHDEAHRRTDVVARGDATRRVLEGRGDGRGTTGRATRRRPWQGTGAAWRDRRREGRRAGRRPSESCLDRRGGELGRDEGSMEALTGEGIEKPGGVADEQPSGPGAARHPVAERPRARDTVRSAGPCATGQGRPRSAERAATIRAATAGAPSDMSRRPPRRPEDDPDVDPSAGHGRDTDVAVIEKDHPRVARAGACRVGIGQVIAQSDPRPETDRAVDAGATEPRQNAGRPRRRSPTRAARTGSDRRPPHRQDPLARSTAVTVGPRRTSAPAVAAQSSSIVSRRARSNPTAGSPPEFGAIGQPKRRPRPRLDPHRRDRPRDASPASRRRTRPAEVPSSPPAS